MSIKIKKTKKETTGFQTTDDEQSRESRAEKKTTDFRGQMSDLRKSRELRIESREEHSGQLIVNS